jgi:hypothetical protein
MTEQENLLVEIQKLRKASRRDRWIVVFLLCCLAVSILAVRAENRRTAVANEFLLKDRSGMVTARLTNDVNGPCLSLGSQSASARAVLCVHPANGSIFLLSADHGQSTVALSPGDGPILPVISLTEKGKPIWKTPDTALR